MQTELVDGKKIAVEILENSAREVSQLRAAGQGVGLAVILVGHDRASVSYTNIKRKRASEIGIVVDLRGYPESVSTQELVADISALNAKKSVSGILVQLPLPLSIDREAVLNAVSPQKDVDCLTTTNKQRLIAGEKVLFYPPAPAAVLRILDYYKVNLQDSSVLLIGSGDLVGVPLSAMLLKKGVNFHLVNKYTDNWQTLARNADIIITGAGKANLVTGSVIKPGAVVIDAGTTGTEGGEIVGDVEQNSVLGKASLLAPVPGGVGPVTVACLLENVVKSARTI